MGGGRRDGRSAAVGGADRPRRRGGDAVPDAGGLGGWDAALDAVADVLFRRLGAERATITGAGHAAQQTGEPRNRRLRAFWQGADGSASEDADRG